MPQKDNLEQNQRHEKKNLKIYVCVREHRQIKSKLNLENTVDYYVKTVS